VLKQMLDFFSYFFASPSILGWTLATIFAAIWLACYRPPFISKPWLWGVLAAGAILTLIAIDITAFPITAGITKLYLHFWSQQTIMGWTWLLSIPSIFIFGLVWEGAKLVPVGIYWWRKNREIEPKLGLLIGAVAGAGFGWFEAQWALNYYILDSKWSWLLVQQQGFPALTGFWESFFVLGLNVASTALAGWGLAKGWGWKFYLLAGFVFLVANYNSVLINYNLVSTTQAEFLIATWALIVVGLTLWLRDRKSKDLRRKSKASRKK
jgi:RsiW-degrading membrane proteinase PrsW (M82 family)